MAIIRLIYPLLFMEFAADSIRQSHKDIPHQADDISAVFKRLKSFAVTTQPVGEMGYSPDSLIAAYFQIEHVAKKDLLKNKREKYNRYRFH